MKKIKQISTLLLLANLTISNMYAGDIRTFTYQEEDYTIETRWINTQATQDYYIQSYSGGTWGYSPFFFVKNDLIYLTKDLGSASSTSLLVIDGKDGSFKEIVPIDWGSYTPNEVAAVYAGTDSEGTCFVASYGTSTSDRYPFHIYPIEITETGQPKVIARYNLEMNPNWWIKSVDVYGSLLSGNFKVASLIWNSRTPVQNLKTSIGIWDYSQSQQTGKQEYLQDLTVSDIKLISDNKLAIHDKHLLTYVPDNFIEKAVAKDPSLYTIDGSNLTLHSSITPEVDDDGLGNGMGFFTLGENCHFMVYASSGYPTEFKLVSLPAYPESFENAEELYVLTPKSVQLSIDKPENDRYYTRVFIEKTDENTANVFVTGHSRGMAAYTITREAPLNTGIETICNDNADCVEYYTVTGLRISDKPSAGFYIEKRGAKVTKKFVK